MKTVDTEIVEQWTSNLTTYRIERKRLEQRLSSSMFEFRYIYVLYANESPISITSERP